MPMNLKNPKEVSGMLRDFVHTCAETHRQFQSGYMQPEQRNEEVIQVFMRSLAVLAEFFDPDIEGESLEPYAYNIPGSLPSSAEMRAAVPQWVLTPDAERAFSALAGFAASRAKRLEAKGDVAGAAVVRELGLEIRSRLAS